MTEKAMTEQQQAHYERCLGRGCSPKLAEMLALASPPMSNTDREFLEGRGGCYDQFGDGPIGAHYRKVAEAGGQDVTGKVYLSGLARYPGDPEAWVTGRGDVQRVCEARGWGCDGAVTVKARKAEGDEGKYRVADDLVEAKALDLMEAGVVSSQEEATDRARAQLSPNWN